MVASMKDMVDFFKQLIHVFSEKMAMKMNSKTY